MRIATLQVRERSALFAEEDLGDFRDPVHCCDRALSELGLFLERHGSHGLGRSILLALEGLRRSAPIRVICVY